MLDIYPKAVLERLKAQSNAGKNHRANAVGKSAVFDCGTHVVFDMTINPGTRRIESIKFRSNGCGFMVSAADILADEYGGRYLTDLHPLTESRREILTEKLGAFPPGREHCADAVLIALKNAFADFRRRMVEEFIGDKPLICTCFGVTEESVEQIVADQMAGTVEEVGLRCNAGTGCGSCQLMIQEIIDSAKSAG